MRNVLIPLLSPEQLTKAFLLEATKGAETVVFLEVIDSCSSLTASEVAERVGRMEKAMEEARFELQKRGVRALFYKEWGDWGEKIRSAYRRENMDVVVVPAKSKIALGGVKLRRI